MSCWAFVSVVLIASILAWVSPAPTVSPAASCAVSRAVRTASRRRSVFRAAVLLSASASSLATDAMYSLVAAIWATAVVSGAGRLFLGGLPLQVEDRLLGLGDVDRVLVGGLARQRVLPELRLRLEQRPLGVGKCACLLEVAIGVRHRAILGVEQLALGI